jgi:hypothetical protein
MTCQTLLERQCHQFCYLLRVHFESEGSRHSQLSAQSGLLSKNHAHEINLTDWPAFGAAPGGVHHLHTRCGQAGTLLPVARIDLDITVLPRAGRAGGTAYLWKQCVSVHWPGNCKVTRSPCRLGNFELVARLRRRSPNGAGETSCRAALHRT